RFARTAALHRIARPRQRTARGRAQGGAAERDGRRARPRAAARPGAGADGVDPPDAGRCLAPRGRDALRQAGRARPRERARRGKSRDTILISAHGRVSPQRTSEMSIVSRLFRLFLQEVTHVRKILSAIAVALLIVFGAPSVSFAKSKPAAADKKEDKLDLNTAS